MKPQPCPPPGSSLGIPSPHSIGDAQPAHSSFSHPPYPFPSHSHGFWADIPVPAMEIPHSCKSCRPAEAEMGKMGSSSGTQRFIPRFFQRVTREVCGKTRSGSKLLQALIPKLTSPPGISWKKCWWNRRDLQLQESEGKEPLECCKSMENIWKLGEHHSHSFWE